ncbi:SPW repeat protein [Natrinema salsiterrestre]|uniref:SPW repeat protein n=1 Tax=Natrinema salsiterrestre TaxID=2950540 RepID=A0A9Q4LA40_9EURY|nr:SPW repeat protein [Natrinema salsiterrestre]MDF9748151.1 SPW repeat protein [Natrinema salsiterrestre]
MSTTTKWLAGINSLLGLWLIVAPFILEAPTGDLWNDVIIGSSIVVIGAYNYYRATNQQSVSTGGATLNVLLGLWLIIAPFVFGVGGALLWSDVIVGVSVASLASYNAYAAGSSERERTAAESSQL